MESLTIYDRFGVAEGFVAHSPIFLSLDGAFSAAGAQSSLEDVAACRRVDISLHVVIEQEALLHQ